MKPVLIRFAVLAAALSVAMTVTVTLAPILQYSYFRYVASSIDAPDPGMPSPLPSGPDTVFIEEMTWIEVREAMKAGKKTVIVPTGGVEQNGPYLVMGKHNLVCRACAEVIARKLGDALVSTTVAFVPQGDFEPPTDHVRYAGTISMSEDTYRKLLTDIGRSYRAEGFEHVVFIADSGGNLDGQKEVAEQLDDRWPDKRTRFHDIKEFHDSYDEAKKWLGEQGLKELPMIYHDEFAITAVLLSIDPKHVRMEERIKAGKFEVNKVNLAPAEKTAEWGRKIIQFRADKTVEAIRKARQEKPAHR
jgi:creatinine amidohydrolase/Fe(II)-dependent formamide hydrolase-like protein